MKINISKLLTAPLISVFILFLSGCMRNKLDTPFVGEDGKVVTVNLQVKIATPVTPEARFVSGPVSKGNKHNKALEISFDTEPIEEPTRSDGTTKLYNLWLFQFDADGTIKGKPHKVTSEATAINDMVMLDVPLIVAKDQTLYLVALGRQIDLNLMSITKFQDIENLQFGYTTVKNGVASSKVTTEEDVPFAGYIKGANVVELSIGENRGQVEYNSPDGFAGGIDIKRLMSKITLRYKFEVPGYTLEGMKLINANSVIRFTNPALNTSSDKYVDLVSLASSVKDADGFYTITWYVAQNQYGNVSSILTENDRYNNGKDGNAPAKATNIEAWAYQSSNPGNYAVYQMYVGKNNINNFDVTANVHYNLITTINADIASAANDMRVRSGESKQSIYFKTSQNVSGDNKATCNDSYDIDAHYDSRPIIINAKGRIVKVGIYTDKECANLVPSSTSWLKASFDNNYTDAYNNTINPLNTELITDIILLPTELRVYLYADEYVTDETGKIPNQAKKRELYVKVTTTTEGVVEGAITQNVVISCIRQQPSIYVGVFGGKPDDITYTTGLCADRIDEYGLAYDPGVISGNKPVWGYYNQKLLSDAEGRYSAASNPHNGWLATKQLVYNAANLPVNLGSSGTLNMENPRKRSDGINPELYQYSYYDTYMARYCYDRNRDDDGSGIIEDDELKWYCPAAYQGYAYLISSPEGMQAGNPTIYTITAYEDGGSYLYTTSSSYSSASIGYYNNRSTGLSFRCVRNVAIQ